MEDSWTPSQGEHRIRVRATDGTGATQTGEESTPEPDGATGWHTVIGANTLSPDRYGSEPIGIEVPENFGRTLRPE